MNKNFSVSAKAQGAQTSAKESVNTVNEWMKKWMEGYYGEWIFAYHPEEKLLLMTYGDGDYDDITNRLVKEKEDGSFSTRAEKIVRNIEIDEIEDAISTIVLKNAAYGMVNIDWAYKEGVNEFKND